MTTVNVNNRKQHEEIEINNDNENENEIDERLLKIYERNLSKISKVSYWMKVFKITGIFTFLIFLITLTVRVKVSFSNFFLLSLIIVALICFTGLLNMYLKLKDIFDEEEVTTEGEEGSSQIGSVLTYFCLNTVAISFMIYMVLVCLKLENFITINWNIIGVPIYVVFGIFLFYAIFILPAFLQNKLYIELIIIFVYLICGFVFTILLNFKLDKNLNSSFMNVFTSIIFALGLHTIYILIEIFNNFKSETFSKFGALIFALLSIVSLVLIPLKADGLIPNMDYWLPASLVCTGYVFFVLDKIISTLTVEKEEDN
jgi:hypothetical protein